MSRFYEFDVSDVALAEEVFADRTAERMEYELRDRWVMCDICGAEATASERTLKRNGWTLGGGYEICPNHD